MAPTKGIPLEDAVQAVLDKLDTLREDSGIYARRVMGAKTPKELNRALIDIEFESGWLHDMTVSIRTAIRKSLGEIA
jgi:hypothetical protein